MSTAAEELEREEKLEGIGCSRKRKEDPRFIQGKGNYVDDVKMPGMLFADMVRSPYAHARVKSINKEKALAIPGVHAVLTAEDLKPLNLHWMPTLAGDVQAVLADEKVHFQYQEVAVSSRMIVTSLPMRLIWLKWNTNLYRYWWILTNRWMLMRPFCARM